MSTFKTCTAPPCFSLFCSYSYNRQKLIALNPVPKEVKLSNSNYSAWKYHVTYAMKEQLWSILEPPKDNKKSQELNYKNQEAIINILVYSIRLDLLGNLISFHDPKSLWDFLEETYEINIDSRKYHLKNKFLVVTITEESRFKLYFNKFKTILSQLSFFGVTIADFDLVQIVMKNIPHSYDHFLQYYTSAGKYL